MSTLAQVYNFIAQTVPVAGGLGVNVWTRLLSNTKGVSGGGALISADPNAIKRVIFQNKGAGIARLWFTPPGGDASSRALTDGLDINADAPAAGPTFPSGFVDEVPCNHQGDWWVLVDTALCAIAVVVYTS